MFQLGGGASTPSTSYLAALYVPPACDIQLSTCLMTGGRESGTFSGNLLLPMHVIMLAHFSFGCSVSELA